MYLLENYMNLINYIKWNAYGNSQTRQNAEILIDELKETKEFFEHLSEEKIIKPDMAQEASAKYAQICSGINALPFDDINIKEYRECLNQEMLAITYIDTDCRNSLEYHLENAENLRKIDCNREQLNLYYLAEFEEDGVSRRKRINELEDDMTYVEIFANHLKDAGESYSSPELADVQKACMDIQNFTVN